MAMPTRGQIQPVTIVNEDGTPGSLVISDIQPGTTVSSPADTVVNIGATVPLPPIPAGIRRMTVQVTDGNLQTLVRVREVGGTPGTGILLNLYGSRVYGGGDGAVAALEVEHVAGGAAAVAVQFEAD